MANKLYININILAVLIVYVKSVKIIAYPGELSKEMKSYKEQIIFVFNYSVKFRDITPISRNKLFLITCRAQI